MENFLSVNPIRAGDFGRGCLSPGFFGGEIGLGVKALHGDKINKGVFGHPDCPGPDFDRIDSADLDKFIDIAITATQAFGDMLDGDEFIG